MADNKKIAGFKKFTDIKSKDNKIKEINPSIDIQPDDDSDRPMNPNLPKESTKKEKPASRKNIIPQDQDITSDKDVNDVEANEGKVEMFGKVAKLPKNTKASKGYNFLENVKVSKKSIWYIMVEKDNELQMVKYNIKDGVNLSEFITELKSYYLKFYKNDKKVSESINKISVDGNDKYSMIKNIPFVEIEGKKMITKITEDLIRLLSK